MRQQTKRKRPKDSVRELQNYSVSRGLKNHDSILWNRHKLNRQRETAITLTPTGIDRHLIAQLLKSRKEQLQQLSQIQICTFVTHLSTNCMSRVSQSWNLCRDGISGRLISKASAHRRITRCEEHTAWTMDWWIILRPVFPHADWFMLGENPQMPSTSNGEVL